MKRYQGLTLIELVVTVAIAAILLTVAIPSFQRLMEKRQVIGVAEAVYEQLQFARIEAIKRSQEMRVDFVADNTNVWYFGVSNDETDGCDAAIDPATDPDDADVCFISDFDNDGSADASKAFFRFANEDSPKVKMKGPTGNTPNFAGAQARFEPVRGTASAGTVVATSDHYELWVRVSTLGRIRICSPSGGKYVTGYSDQDCSST